MLQDQKVRLRTLYLTLFGSLFILAVKIVAYLISDSTALKSDAIESISNVAASVFALFAIVYSGRPADKNHPYGHGKIEDVSAAFEGGLITFAAAFILYEGVRALINPPPIQNLGGGLLLNFAAGILNGGLGFYLVKVGRKHSSTAMEADGFHLLTDFYTTLGIAAGLLLVKFTGVYWLDPVLAIAVGLLLAATGFKIVKKSCAALLDSEDPTLIQKLVDIMNEKRNCEIIAAHELRTMRTGRFTHVDVHIVVPEFYEIKKAHDAVENFGEAILREGVLEGEFHSHVDPCARAYCAKCCVEPCPVRRENYSGTRVPLTTETATEHGPAELH